MSFEAKYAGTCSACGVEFKPGERVTYVLEELVHNACPEPREQCLGCFTEKAVDGSCLCG